MRRHSLALDIDDQLLRGLLSEEIVERPGGTLLVHQQNRGCLTTGRRVPNSGVFLQPRWALNDRGFEIVKQIAVAVAVCFLCQITAVSADSDPRELVVLPAMMQEHMLANMRDHLLAVAQIQDALGDGKFDVAARIAEERIGMSSLASHGAQHMAPYMPKPMQAMGTEMHRAASRFALVAQETFVDGDWARTMKSLSSITQQCVACHAAYRIH